MIPVWGGSWNLGLVLMVFSPPGRGGAHWTQRSYWSQRGASEYRESVWGRRTGKGLASLTFDPSTHRAHLAWFFLETLAPRETLETG